MVGTPGQAARRAAGVVKENAALMQITQTGLQPAPEAQLAQWRAEFAARHCVRLPQLLDAALVRRLWQRIEAAAFEPAVHPRNGGASDFSRDLMLRLPAVAVHEFHLLLNHPKLFEAVRQITGCPPIGGFSGRIYRVEPDAGHYLDWHEDIRSGNYLVGLSVNLGPAVYSGGVFQIRERQTKRLTGEVAHDAPGDAHLFSIAPELEHRLTPLTGTVARTAGAGWFCVESEFMTALKGLAVGRARGTESNASGI